MARENRCPHCGDDLPPDAPQGVCPRCLMQAGLVVGPKATLDTPSSIECPGSVIDHFELLELIGEGGMGLVYLAQQKEPVRRKVVLKIVKPGMDSKQVIARFEAEKQALALLDHPNIAHVFDAGATEAGRPYFVMEYVKGTSIIKYCDERKLNIEQRLRLFEQVCEGIHHAHQKGIIHRDIKPSNILISVHGDKAVPKIIDFGIAKAITQPLTDKTFVTFQGQLLGTPEYMSPEQVDLATQDIDTRSDIYSLGVVLYELLAGVLPFERESFERAGFAEIQRTIRELEPASPSIRLTKLGEKAKIIAASRSTQVVPLARRLHRELEWIPLKAMRKDRCRRYRSASELADDVRNYLNGLPLIAGPETAVYRMQKFVRKHAGSVATVALVAVAIVLGFVFSIAMYLRAEDARQKEATARAQAEQATKKEATARADAEQAKEKETIARTQAEQAEQATKQKAEELRRTLYVNSIQLADAKYREGNTNKVRELLAACPNDLRGWEWDRINHTLDQSEMSIATGQDGIVSLALSPDGKRVVSSGWDMTIKVWDMAKGSELVTIKVGDKKAYLQALYHGDLDGWRQARLNLAWSIAFSPNGKQIASGHESGEIKIWDAATGKQLKTLQAHKNPIDSIAFSLDGKRMASRAYEIKLWDTSNWTELMSLHDRASTGMDSCVTFSPDGKRIASTGGEDDQIKVWDTVTGQGIWSIWGHDYYAYSVSFSPDGKFLASGGDNEIKIWDAPTGSNVMTLRGQDASVCSVAFSPDGKYVASGSRDNTIRVWDITTRETMMTLRGHEHVVQGVRFTPDGKRLVSHSWDGKIKIWDMCPTRESTKLVRHKTPVGSLAFSPDGKRVVSVDGISVKLWDVESAAESKTLYKGRRYMRSSVAFSPDGKRIALHDFSGTFRIWDAASGNEIVTFRGPKPRSRIGVEIAFSPDGKLIASCGGVDKTVKVWDATRGEEVATLKGRASLVCSVAFSPDGKFIVAGGHDPDIKVWEWATGRESMTLRGHDKGTIRSVSFSPDGKRIVSASHQDHTMKLWDATTGAELMTLKHADSVTSAAFSPDSKRIVSGCLDGAARVWDAVTGAELLALRAGFSVLDVAFSPDGKTIAGGLLDHTIALWESAPPLGGYAQRKIGAAARRIVDQLHEKHGSYNEVISQLQHDVTSDAAIRKLAMQIASSNKWEDAEKLEDEAWEVIVAPDKDVKVYQAALEEANKANVLEPNDPTILNTLAAAQYRVGSYEDALKTLTKSERILSDAGEEPDPWNLAFKAMTLNKIGRMEEAKAALGQLQEMCRQEHLDWDMDVQGLLAEAEALIAGEKR
jgi:WD40 repeat protein/serine/threonine protein kinase